MKKRRDLVIIQVVGYKRSGKTTLINKLIASVTEELSLKVATLKHHGHGGEPDIVTGTDSYQHLQAGAFMSGVQGENRLQLKVSETGNYEIADLIAIYQHFPIDVLIIEGYKRAHYPKIVLINDRDDEQLLDLHNIVAIGGWSEPMVADKQYPTFSIVDFENYKELFQTLITNV